MAYERQYYTDGDVLNAEQLNHMESGIKENSDNIGKLSEEIADLKENGTGGGLALEKVTDGEVMTSVEEIILATGITLNKTVLSFTESATQTLVATVTPSDATEKVVWTSSNENVATVENGVVTPVASGSCTITATVGSFSARCSVTVDIEVIVTYTITRNLTGCASNNSVTTINEGSALTETFTASNNYTLDGATVSVTMGGVDISSNYVNGVLTVASVTGDIVITVTAKYNAVAGSAVKASIETIDGTDYMVVNDIILLDYDMDNDDSYHKVFTYRDVANDKYKVYEFSKTIGGTLFDWNNDNFIGNSNIPKSTMSYENKSSATGQNELLNDPAEGDLWINFLPSGTEKIAYVRLPADLGGYSTPVEYLQNKYGLMKFAIKDGYVSKAIDPALITTIEVKENSDARQYAQFVYGDSPSANLYSGMNSLSVATGGNANLSGAYPPKACMSTTKLSINFTPNTFTDFTLENVKQYLTDNPLVFWYMAS